MKSLAYIDPTQDRRWDEFVQTHPQGLICHLSGWKQAIERSFPHIKGYFPVLFDPGTGEIRAGMPVYLVSSRITGRRLVSIPFATLSDPLASSREDMQVLTDAVLQLAGHCRAKRIEIRTLATANLVEDPRFEHIDFFKHHYLLLDEPMERIEKRFHKKSVRPIIKRCARNGLELSVDSGYRDLECFFEAHLSTRKKLGLPPQPFHFFKHLWEVFGPSRNLRIFGAKFADKTVASTILYTFKDRVSWEFIGEHPEHRYLNPTHFLLWHAIRLAQQEGYKIFDFGRTSPNNLGLMGFKQRWGTIAGELPQFWYPQTGNSHCSLAMAEQSFRYRAVRLFTRKSPRALLPWLGELCYRHMG